MIHGILLNDFYEGKICVIICSLPLVYLCINNVIINMISYEGIYLTFIYLHSYEGTLHTVLLLACFEALPTQASRTRMYCTFEDM